MTVAADAPLRAHWPNLVQRVRDELRARDGIDLCARVELRLREDAAIGVHVFLPDGRSASRRAVRREDVVPTLQALLLVPEHATAAARAEPTDAERDAGVAVPGPSPRALGIELSAITGARIGDGQASLGLGALSFLEVGGWLLGFEGRADSYQNLSGGQPEAALELAVLLGKRLHFQGVALDLTAGPAVAMKGISSTEDVRVTAGGPAPPPQPPPPTSDPSSGPVPRLLLGSRLGFSPRSVFRTFIGVDGELGPTHATDSGEVNAGRLPLWTLGLALGATVGTK
jgi:hypothetical protein